MPGLASTAAAFQEGSQFAEKLLTDKRQRREALADEERQAKAKDLFAKRTAIVNSPDIESSQRLQALTKIETDLNQLYHPVYAPGALQKDWNFLKELFTRKTPVVPVSTEIPASVADPVSITPEAQSVTLPKVSAQGMTDKSAADPGTPEQQITLPPEPLTIPGSSQPRVVPAQKSMTPYQRRVQAQHEDARKAAEMLMLGAPPTPEEEGAQEGRKTLARVQSLIEGYKADNPDATPAQIAAHSSQLWDKELGTIEKPVWKEFKSPDGKLTNWFDVTKGNPPGWIATGGGTSSSGGGTAFERFLTRKYGASYTALQEEAERIAWAKMGAHGTQTITSSTADAAGNLHTRSMRVPVFEGMPPGELPPQLAAKFGEAPQAASVGGEAPMGRAATKAGRAAVPAAAPSGPQSSTGVAVPLPPQLTSPASPAIAQPSLDDSAAALAEATRLGIRNDVLGVAAYRINPSNVTSTRGGQKTKFLELVQRVNPAYDSTRWDAVQQARSSFTAKGNDMVALQSLGLAVNHLHELMEKYKALGNTWSPDTNAMINAGKMHAGSGGPIGVETAANAVAGEMANVFKRTGATDVEIQGWLGKFSANMSPEQFKQSVNTMTNLMSGRMIQEAQTYVDTFGNLTGFPPLAPSVVQILQKVDSPGAKDIVQINQEAMQGSGIKPTPGRATTGTPPPAAAAPAGADQYTYITNGTKVYRAKKGTPIPQGWKQTNAPASPAQ